MQVSGFDWDDGNALKCQKHGCSLEEVESVFRGLNVYIAPDLKHSTDETRLLAIGRSEHGRYLFVAFTLRGRDLERKIRPISARYMHQKEIRAYEETIARSPIR